MGCQVFHYISWHNLFVNVRIWFQEFPIEIGNLSETKHKTLMSSFEIPDWLEDLAVAVNSPCIDPFGIPCVYDPRTDVIEEQYLEPRTFLGIENYCWRHPNNQGHNNKNYILWSSNKPVKRIGQGTRDPDGKFVPRRSQYKSGRFDDTVFSSFRARWAENEREDYQGRVLL